MRISTEILTFELVSILKNNSPVRQYPLGAIGKKGTPFYSPYPGNLKNNGIIPQVFSNLQSRTTIGGPVGYAVFTETTSHKPGWQQKSFDEFVNRLCTVHGGVKR